MSEDIQKMILISALEHEMDVVLAKADKEGARSNVTYKNDHVIYAWEFKNNKLAFRSAKLSQRLQKLKGEIFGE